MIFNRWTIPFAAVACVVALSYAVLVEMQAEEPIFVPPQYEARLIVMDREAVDRAYEQHIQNLFLSWMKDSTGQPERATRGGNQARRAYIAIMQRLDERAKRQEQR